MIILIITQPSTTNQAKDHYRNVFKNLLQWKRNLVFVPNSNLARLASAFSPAKQITIVQEPRNAALTDAATLA